MYRRWLVLCWLGGLVSWINLLNQPTTQHNQPSIRTRTYKDQGWLGWLQVVLPTQLEPTRLTQSTPRFCFVYIHTWWVGLLGWFGLDRPCTNPTNPTLCLAHGSPVMSFLLYGLGSRDPNPTEHHELTTVFQGCERPMFGLYPSHGSLAH